MRYGHLFFSSYFIYLCSNKVREAVKNFQAGGVKIHKTFLKKLLYCTIVQNQFYRRGLPVSTAVAALIEDLTDRTSFFKNVKE